jgi:hypothetical protein
MLSASPFKTDNKNYGSYQVIAVNNKGIESFATEPIEYIPATGQIIIEAETVAPKANYPYQGFNADGFIELSKELNKSVSFVADITKAGTYSIDFRYANGNGPTNTENKCAIRTLSVDIKKAGTIVLPQRGKGEWSNWGYTNSVLINLPAGKHTITLSFEEFNENMNGDINQAMLDELRLVLVK